MIVVTGATGHLGRLVVDELLRRGVAPEDIAAVVRDHTKSTGLAARGVRIRVADYDRPATLPAALEDAEKLLFISGNEVGRRIPQHRNVIDAAVTAGVSLIAYTSILYADTSTLALAAEHAATERMIRESGLPFVFLRNSWYTENYTGNLDATLAQGVILGSADGGRVGAVPRADYAAAAAAVMTTDGHRDQIYELGADEPFTMSELAAEITRQSGALVAYTDLPAEEYVQALVGFGIPEPYAAALADSDEGIARGELRTDSGDLRRLIGRPTTSLAEAVAAGLKE